MVSPAHRILGNVPGVFIGGVGQLYQGDLDAGRLVVERLSAGGLPPEVVAEDCYYGAIAVCQRIQEVQADLLILVGAALRGRRAGTVTRTEVAHLARQPEEFQQAVAEAATGYVSIELILEVASALHMLPPRTVVIEIEPEITGPSDTLSPAVRPAVWEAVRLIQRELQAALVHLS
jgi:hydrogenase maturation protease